MGYPQQKLGCFWADVLLVTAGLGSALKVPIASTFDELGNEAASFCERLAKGGCCEAIEQLCVDGLDDEGRGGQGCS